MIKTAIPLTDNKLSEHFGHCEQFAIYELDDEKRIISGPELVPPPPHEPGVFPKWLKSLGTDLVIAGGMGKRALDLFSENGIAVISGTAGETPEAVIEDFRKDALGDEKPSCNHDHDDHHCA